MLLYDIVCFLFLVPLPPVSEITPLKVDQFAWELRNHLNRQLCNFVLDGLCNGFKLGFQPALSLKSAKKNTNLQPTSSPWSLMSTWPTRFPGVGLRALSDLLPSPTFI